MQCCFIVRLVELSPTPEAVSSAATQEFPSTLWDLKVYYRVHKSLSPVYILSHINPVLTTLPYFSKIQFNIIAPRTSRSLYRSLSFPIRATPHAHLVPP